MDVLIGQVESTLETMPISMPVLWKRVENAEKAWDEFEGQYDKMRSATGDKRVQELARAEQDHIQHAEFQRRYYEVLARAENAFINDEQCRREEQSAEDARLKALASEEEARLKELKN